MRAAIIVDGKVDNVIEVDALDAIAGVVLIEAPTASVGDLWNGANFTSSMPPLPAAIPEEISPRQFRQALTKYGFRQQVDNAIAASTDQDLKDWYAYTSAFQRHHPEVLNMAQQLGFTSAQMDQVWTYGASLV